ncbi:metal ABC transporter substrate-binding protein [Clostridium sp. cel8]|uniref:metal ABC transporter substrate-binding protein n=1 Tax=unclassified Clostridium TaxID=2614128 RepID=UPI0015F3CCBD|nr:zinc ABC transporter substrate-binding protein [Clostridium sp. cel8]MBA5850814.1 metal ABC transporter substrate-binding protein [Clostridium sp. cel8]
MKKFLEALMLIIIIFTTGCNNTTVNDKKNNSTYSPDIDKSVNLQIMTTDKLTYSIVKTIVKTKHTVNYMFKDRESEVNFKFTYDSLNNISKKDLFIYTGSSYEPWIDSFIEKLNKNKVSIINSSRGAKLLSYKSPLKYANIEVSQNPYYFMDIDNYKVMLLNIKNSIEDKDPKNRSFYEKNFSDELKKLSSYEKELKTIDNNLSNYTFLTLNERLNYFINYNDLNMLDIDSSSDNTILPVDTEERKAIESKLNKYVVFIYTDNSELKNNYTIIKDHNMKTAKIKLFDGTESYEDVIKYNINVLKKIYEPE